MALLDYMEKIFTPLTDLEPRRTVRILNELNNVGPAEHVDGHFGAKKHAPSPFSPLCTP